MRPHTFLFTLSCLLIAAYNATAQHCAQAGMLPPTVTTGDVTILSGSSATCIGTVADNGGGTVTHRGLVWSVAPNPTTSDALTNDGTGTGGFTGVITGLTEGTEYFVRAFATNASGTSYGNEVNFTTPESTIGTAFHTCGADNIHNTDFIYDDMILDQEGNVYRTIVIGTQEWMAENLKTSIYRNGDPILTGVVDTEWGDTIVGSWAANPYVSDYECPYGKLYTWYAVTDPRSICPTGWHMPTHDEWGTLVNFLGGSSVAGGKMKTLTLWEGTNVGATNESGFSGLPGGWSQPEGYASFGQSGYYWSSTESTTNSTYGFYRQLQKNGANVINGGHAKSKGFSVRCVKD